jgi:hypothetical protein
VKFADSKKQGKIKDELGGADPITSTPINVSSNLSQASAAKPDFWVKQYQLQLQQQQQMIYSYGVAQQQVQQQLYSTQNVSMMPYGNPQSQQSQTPQFLYMQQNPNQYYPSSTTNSSFGRAGTIDADVEQMSRPVQQQHNSRQAQNLSSLRDVSVQSNDPNRDPSSRGRLNVADSAVLPSGSSSHDMMSHLSSISPTDRSAVNQRPPEG